MSRNKIKRRACQRFTVSGALVAYKRKRLFSSLPVYEKESFPILNLSSGGLRFVCQEKIRIDSKLYLKLSFPKEDTSLELQGQVRWIMPYTERSYKYQIGIQFNPYGSEKDNNSPESLKKIKSLEKKYATKKDED